MFDIMGLLFGAIACTRRAFIDPKSFRNSLN